MHLEESGLCSFLNSLARFTHIASAFKLRDEIVRFFPDWRGIGTTQAFERVELNTRPQHRIRINRKISTHTPSMQTRPGCAWPLLSGLSANKAYPHRSTPCWRYPHAPTVCPRRIPEEILRPGSFRHSVHP